MTSRGQSRGRRGLAVLAWGLGLYALAQLAGGLALDYIWPDVRFPSFGQVLQHWRACKRTPDVLCIGSSRFGAGIVPAAMRGAFREALGADCRIDVFNASVPVGDPLTEEYEFNRLVRDGSRPGMLVLEVAPETVNAYNEWFAIHVARQVRWEDVPADLPDVWRSQQIGRLIATRLMPLFTHRQEIWRRLARLGEPAPPLADDSDQVIDWKQVLGSSLAAPVGEERLAHSLAGVEMAQKRLRHYRIGGMTAGSLERLLDRCRTLHIPVVLVGVPVTSFFRQCCTPEIDAAYSDYMTRLCRTYGCRFVDWRDQIADSGFVDVHHLESAGGYEFSGRLTREVLAPIWRETHPGDAAVAVQSASP